MNNLNLQSIHPVLKIFAYIIILLLGASVFTLAGSFLASIIYNIPFNDIELLMKNNDALILLQIFSAIGTFIIPAFIYSKIFENKPFKFLKLNKAPSVKVVFFTIIIFILANFVLDLLVKTTNLIPFESFDNSFIQYLLQNEKDGAETIKRFLNFTSPLKFVLVFFMMAVLPGLGEELSFRGVFMTLFKKASNNNIIFSIVFSAFIFSAIHVQLHNFLAIFFMGILLGTVYHLTKNLWYSIIAHLFNNGLIVTASYLSSLGLIQQDLTKTDTMPIKISIFGSIIFIFAFILYKKFLLKEKQNPNV